MAELPYCGSDLDFGSVLDFCPVQCCFLVQDGPLGDRYGNQGKFPAFLLTFSRSNLICNLDAPFIDTQKPFHSFCLAFMISSET